MCDELSDHLRVEREAVESEIRAAFKGVTRTGGVSWSQAEAIDPGGNVDPRALAEALARDTERSWEELVDDPRWTHDIGVGGFPFLDPIGTRYYLAPAMLRELQREPGPLASVLTVDSEYQRQKVSRLTAAQSAAVARFIRFMVATLEVAGAGRDEESSDYFAWVWRTARDSYWHQFDSR